MHADAEGDCVLQELARNVHDLPDPVVVSAIAAPRSGSSLALVGDGNQPLRPVVELNEATTTFGLLFCRWPRAEEFRDIKPARPVGEIPTGPSAHRPLIARLVRLCRIPRKPDHVPARKEPALDRGTPVDWALEAHKAARDVAVAGLTMDAHLGADYLAAVRPTLEPQLAVAWLCLARTLNEALSRQTCPLTGS